MPRKQKKYHYIYKTTCIITGKFYIGMHSTNNLYDDYLGSGKILRYSLNKYGKSHHILEILEFHTDRKTLSAREEELVNEEMVNNCICMNLKTGGSAGIFYPSEETKKKLRERTHTEETKKKMSISATGYIKSKEHCRHLSESLRKKDPRLDEIQYCAYCKKVELDRSTKLRYGEYCSRKCANAASGSKNDWVWLYNPKTNKSTKKYVDEIKELLDCGWIIGRKASILRDEIKYCKYCKKVELDAKTKMRGGEYCSKSCSTSYRNLFEGLSKAATGKKHKTKKQQALIQMLKEYDIEQDFTVLEYKQWIMNDRDKNTCRNPKCKGRSSKLCLHYINGDKVDLRPINIITVCKSCELASRTNRIKWAKLFAAVIGSK